MKTPRILTALLLCALAACSTPPTQTQILTTAADIANTAGADYTAYAAAQAGTLTPAQASAALTAASNDMYGAAALANAYNGSATPIAAQLQTGAANVSTAAKIINALPNSTISNTTVANLTQAAVLLSAQAKGTPGAQGPSGKRGLPSVWLGATYPLGLPLPVPTLCYAVSGPRVVFNQKP